MNQFNQFIKVKKHIESFGYQIVDYDFERPWGGFLVIDEAQSQKFANQFFDGIPIGSLKIGGKLSPKYLLSTQTQDSHGNITTEELKFGASIKEPLALSDPMIMIKNLF